MQRSLSRLERVLILLPVLRFAEMVVAVTAISVVFYYFPLRYNVPAGVGGSVLSAGWIWIFYNSVFFYLPISVSLFSVLAGLLNSKRSVALVNGSTFIVHSLAVIHSLPNADHWAFWAAWCVVAISNLFLPFCFPSWIFPPRAQ